MKFSFLKNKRFLILVLVILILGAGGFFYWQKNKLTPPEEWDTAKVSPREDYRVIEQEDGLLVKNEKAGLSFKLPEGWKVEEKFSSIPGSGGIAFSSPNIVTGSRSAIVTEGCRLKVGVAEVKTDIKTLKSTIPKRFSQYGAVTLEGQSVIEIRDRKAIRHVFKDRRNKMYFIGIDVPVDNNLYEIILDTADKDQRECRKEFDQILETISIK